MNKKQKLLCVDFEFQNEIYNKIWERNKNIDVTIINRADMALELMKKVKFDYLITTIVIPGKVDGLKFIDEIQSNSNTYGDLKITILTGLGGEKFYEEVKKRNVGLINRYERAIREIESEIDLFLQETLSPLEEQYPEDDVRKSLSNKKLQNEVPYPGLLDAHDNVKCQNCNFKNIKWVRFRSPQETWDMLCGRDSWLLICTECMMQYEEVPISMS